MWEKACVISCLLQYLVLSNSIAKYVVNTPSSNRNPPAPRDSLFADQVYTGQTVDQVGAPICSPWTFRENHSPNIIFTS